MTERNHGKCFSFCKVLPTFVNKLDSNSSKSCARGWRHVSYLLASRLRHHVSLLVCFYKIIFKERANSFSKTRYPLKSFIYFGLEHRTILNIIFFFWMAKKKTRFVTI